MVFAESRNKRSTEWKKSSIFAEIKTTKDAQTTDIYSVGTDYYVYHRSFNVFFSHLERMDWLCAAD